MTLKEMAEKRKALLAQNKAIIDACAKDEGRVATEEEQKTFAANDAELVKLNNLIQMSDRQNVHSAAAEAHVEPITSTETLHSRDEVLSALQQNQNDPSNLELGSHSRRRTLTAFRGPKAKEAAYRSGRFLAGALFGHEKSRLWCEQNGVPIRAALSEGINTAGGVLVPDEMERAIIDLVQQFGVVRRNARVRAMTSETLIVPRKRNRLTAYPVGEGGTGTASQEVWDAIQLVAKSWQTETRYSAELSEDAIIDIAADIATDAALAFAYAEDYAGLLGDGTSTYHGIQGIKPLLNDGSHTASVVTSATGHTAFSTLTYADFNLLVGAMPLFPGARERWYISKAGYASSMLNILLGLGGVTMTEGIDGSRTPTFMGYPVELCQVMNSTLTAQTSTTGLCMFGDLGMSVAFGDRRGITMASNPYTYMGNRQIAIYGWERFDIVCHEAGSLTPTGNPVCSMISLSTAGS